MFIENFNLLYNHSLHFCASESPGGVVKLQMAPSQPQSFWFWGGDHTLSTTVLKSGRTLYLDLPCSIFINLSTHSFIHSLIHSLNTHWLNSYFTPSTLLDSGNRKMDRTQCPKEFMALWGTQTMQSIFILQCGKCHGRDMASVLLKGIREGFLDAVIGL